MATLASAQEMAQAIKSCIAVQISLSMYCS